MSSPDDPERLVDTKPRSQLGELFASASRDLPSDEQLAQVAAQLGPILDGSPAPAAPAGKSLLIKLGMGAGAVALLVGAGFALRRPSHPAPISNATVPQVSMPTTDAASSPPPAITAPPSPLAPATQARESSSARATEKPPAAVSGPNSAAASKALGEAALLEQARRALNTSPSYALQLANQHRVRFPHGILTQEREVIAIEALRKLHRSSEADQRASGFAQAFPGSAHQRVVDEAAPK